MTELLRCDQLVVVYQIGTSEVIALQGLDLVIEPGEMVGIIGSSGSGKSTLLSVVSGLLRPTGGSVTFDGRDLGRSSRRELDAYRSQDVGFVWQDSDHNLIPYLGALDNVALPLAGRPRREARSRSTELLQRVGLGARTAHRPAELSGGERARLALAVALAHQPRLLLADEPTGELDRSTTEAVFALMRKIGAETGLTQIVVSHDDEIASHVDRVISLRDGRVAAEQRLRRNAQGEAEIVEVAMIDTIGRLQLTDDQRALIGKSGRVHTEIVGDEVRIRAAAAEQDGTTDE